MDRRLFIGGCLASGLASTANAQSYPTRPVKVVVPFAAGGPTDFIMRLLVDPMGAKLGQSVIVENRPGAAGNIGAAAVAQGDADGYTLVHGTVAMLAVNPLLYPGTFQPQRDLVTIATTASLPNILVVNPKVVDVSTIAELVAYAKRKPGGLTFGTFGPGSSPHITGALFQKLTGIEATPVVYRGSSQAITDIIGGRIDFLFDSATTSTEHILAGTIRGLGITAGERLGRLPAIPTMKEAGFAGFDLTFWLAVQAPSATPKDVVDRLRTVLLEVTSAPEFADALRKRGAEPFVVPAAKLDAFVESEATKWAQAARDIGLKPS